MPQLVDEINTDAGVIDIETSQKNDIVFNK